MPAEIIPLGFLYRLTFPNGKAYIGITTGTVRKRFNDHVCASTRATNTFAVHRAIKKYGRESVKVETLATASFDCLKDIEVRAIAVFGTKAPNGYNLTDGGDGTIGVIRSKETLANMRAAQLGSTRTDETKANMRAAKLGKKFSPEHKAKIGLAHKGKFVSAETREKISLAKTGTVHSSEAREKMSVQRLGKKKTAETREKMGAWQIGRKLSVETIAKREATKAAKKSIALN